MYPWNMRTKQAVPQLSALAHEGRLTLFRILVQAGPEGLAAGEVARAGDLNFTTASAQLSVLANAGLVASRREGRSIVYTADFDAVSKLLAFLMKDCCQGRSEVLAPLAGLASSSAACRQGKGETQ
jgi:DNA-binding transcriptional ArsR family regulator